MSVETWGLLPKAQDDPQTIAEAIAAGIAAHEADPEAHLGAGESLEAHRANEVVDHPAGSLVPDKFSFTQRDAITYFESGASWQTQGSAIFSFLKLRVGVFGNATQDSYAYQEEISFSANDAYFPLDNYIQFNGRFSNFYDIATIYMGIGVSDAVPSSDYALFFRIVGTTLSVGYSTGGSISYTTIGALSQDQYHTFRIQTSNEFGEAYFLVDGVVVHTVDLSSLEDWNYTTFGVYVEKTGGTTNGQFKGLESTYLAAWNPRLGAPI